MITRKQAQALSDLFCELAVEYNDATLEKVAVRFEPGNNMVIEWDDLAEDDRESIEL